MSGVPSNASFSGCLSKKKNNHGRFEDPWKQKVFCWIADGKLNLCPAGPDKKPMNIGDKDVYDLLDWAVMPDKDGKFTLASDTTSSNDALKLKADTNILGEEWIQAIREESRKASRKLDENREAALELERKKVENERKARLEAESAARRAEEKREEESRTPRELTPHACEWGSNGCKFTGSFDEVVRHEATCKLKAVVRQESAGAPKEEDDKRFSHAQKMVSKLSEEVSEQKERLKHLESKVARMVDAPGGSPAGLTLEQLLDVVSSRHEELERCTQSAEMALDLEMENSAKLQIELEEAQERLLQGGAASTEVETELAMQVASMEVDLEKLKQKAEKATNEAEEATNEAKEATKEAAHLRAKLAQMEEDGRAVEEKAAEECKRREAAQEEAKKLTLALAAKCKALEEQLAAAKDEVAAKEEVASLAAERANAAASDKEGGKVKEVEGRVKELERRLKEAQEERAAADEQRAAAEEQRAAADARARELEAELAEAQGRMKAGASETTEALRKEAAAEKKAAAAEEKVAAAEQARVAAERKAAALAEELVALAEQSAAQSSARMAGVEESDEKLRNELQKLRNELAAAKHTTATLAKELEEGESKRAREAAAGVALTERLSKLEGALEERENGAEKEARKLSGELAEMTAELKALRNAKDQGGVREQLLRDQLAAQAAAAEAHRQERDKELEVWRNKAGAASVEAATKARQDQEKTLAKMAEHVRALEEDNCRLKTRTIAQEADLEISRAERKELEALVNTLRAQGGEANRALTGREALGVRSANANTNTAYTNTAYPGSPGGGVKSPAAHLFMAGSLSGTPGKVAKILLGSSERHRLATADYLASLLDGTAEINRVGKSLLAEDMAEIAAYVKTHPKVERLFLSGNNLGLAGAKHLCALLLHPSLRLVRLDLRHNNLGNEGCTLLVEAMSSNRTVARMDLSANAITAPAATAIALTLEKNASLTRLDLRHNDLGDAGAATIASALKARSCILLHLDLSANSIGHKGAEALAMALKVNTVLQVLDMRGNAVSAAGIKALEDSKAVSVSLPGSQLPHRQLLLPLATR